MTQMTYTPPSQAPLTPVGNQVAAEAHTATQAATRQAQQSVQHSQFVHQQMTAGLGVFTFDVDFPVTFTAEPVFSHGMTLPAFGATVAGQADVQALRTTYDQAWKAYSRTSGSGPERIAAQQAYAKAKAALDQALAAGAAPSQIPLASAYVKRWKVNDQNLYVGAEMIIVIRAFGVAATPAPEPEPSGSIPSAS